MRTHIDIQRLKPIANGVNIKFEKCGGYRGALRLVDTAITDNMEVWFGCMVGSNLNSTAASHLFSLATSRGGSDLDGSLLVSLDSQLFEGGFNYTGATDT